MKKRFVYELVVGAILLSAILLFGEKGFAAIVLLAGYSFVRKKKNDEREIQLLYKVGNYTAAFSLLGAIVIFYFSNKTVNGYLINDNWLGLLVAIFLLSHSIAGLLIFRTK